ncbi:eCIS core domain-containing protein [Roseateles cavernae]|uniref:eCIS core domain-containing protein n=1 Tax=Roseateles cavernae TaxID=3153578 RepID=UPI0032E3BCE9
MKTRVDAAAHDKQPLEPASRLGMQQGRAATGPRQQQQHQQIAQLQQSVPDANRTGLPDSLKNGIEALSGMDMSGVRVHRNSSKPAALQAHAYAQGSDIHLGPGQERHLPHEAWHLVQQRQGRVRPTRHSQGVAINDSHALESEADRMGARAGQVAQRRAMAPLRHAAGCCCGSCGSSNSAQLVRSARLDGAVQLKTSVSITDGSQTAQGESGHEDTTRGRFAQWPGLRSRFEAVVNAHTMPELDDGGVATGKTYSRNRYMCAEPNALGNLLNHYASSTTHGLTNGYLASLSFPALAIDDKTGGSIAPCPVCSQWVSAVAPMAVHTLGAVDMVNQRELDARDELRRARLAEEEEASRRAQEKEQKKKERETHSAVDLAIDQTIEALLVKKKGELQRALKAAQPASTGKKAKKGATVLSDGEITAYLRGWMGSLKASSPHTIKVLATFDEGQADELTAWARSNHEDGA